MDLCCTGLVFWPVRGTVVLSNSISPLFHYKGNNNNSCTYLTEDFTEKWREDDIRNLLSLSPPSPVLSPRSCCTCFNGTFVVRLFYFKARGCFSARQQSKILLLERRVK